MSDDAIVLNPSDPFERALIDMVQTNRAKRRDYAVDGEWDSNFRQVADMLGIEGVGRMEICLALVGVKIARLRNLRANGRMADPANESVLDTYKDNAVYSSILYGMALEELGEGAQ